jgi:predicted phosphoribosyltransferase
MRAAIRALRGLGAAAIVVAVPTAPRETCEALGREVEDVVCATTPEPFTAVGIWYRDFRPVTDEQVRDLLGWI